MIDYINKQLVDWARWRVSSRMTLRHMLGVKGCWPAIPFEPYSKKLDRQATAQVPLNDLECWATDRAVCALSADLKAAVVEFYTRTGTADTTAKRLGISKATLFRRIDQAHCAILGSLNDIAAGLHLARSQTLPEKNACNL